MSSSPKGDAIAHTLEVLKTIPGAGGYILAMVAFMVFGWIFARWALSSQRSFTQSQQSLQGVVTMSEGLREAMRLEKMECEKECSRLREINQQLLRDRDELIRQHTMARQQFLEEAREQREMAAQLRDMHQRAMVEEQRLREELAAMVHTVSILTQKLDNANNLRRSTDGND